MAMEDEYSLESLLAQDGSVLDCGRGYIVKIKAKEVSKSENIPHGIDYCLVLLNRHRRRVFGIDNAHAVKPKRKKFGAKKVTWDHKHKVEKLIPYEFKDVNELLEAFWSEVEQIIQGEK